MSKQSKKTTKPAAHPWVIDGIDYGPAIAAAGDLAAWAFDLAAKDVADWPEGKRASAPRGATSSATARQAPAHHGVGDVLFTAGLLARISSGHRLGMSERRRDPRRVGLPTEIVPRSPRAQRQTRVPRLPVMPRAPRPGPPPRRAPEPARSAAASPAQERRVVRASRAPATRRGPMKKRTSQ